MRNIKRLWRASKKLRRSDQNAIPRLVVSAEVQAFIRSEVENFHRDVETGGILMGLIESPMLIRVTHASGPGPNAVHTPSYFLRDTAYCTRILEDFYGRFAVDYVGEWHSHVKPLRYPSPGDLLTLSGIMSDPDYNFSIFAMLLAVPVRKRRSRLDLHGFVASKESVTEVIIQDEVSYGR